MSVGERITGRITKRITGVSSYLEFELSGSNCVENSTPKPRGMEIWLELSGVRVTEVILYNKRSSSLEKGQISRKIVQS